MAASRRELLSLGASAVLGAACSAGGRPSFAKRRVAERVGDLVAPIERDRLALLPKRPIALVRADLTEVVRSELGTLIAGTLEEFVPSGGRLRGRLMGGVY